MFSCIYSFSRTKINYSIYILLYVCHTFFLFVYAHTTYHLSIIDDYKIDDYKIDDYKIDDYKIDDYKIDDYKIDDYKIDDYN